MGFKSPYHSEALLRTFVGYLVFAKRSKDLSITRFAKGLDITKGGVVRQLQTLEKMGYLKKNGNHKPQTFSVDWNYLTKDFLKKYSERALVEEPSGKIVKIDLTESQLKALKTLIYNHFLEIAWIHPGIDECDQGTVLETEVRGLAFHDVIKEIFNDLIALDLNPYSEIKEVKELLPAIARMKKYNPMSGLLWTLELIKTTKIAKLE